MTTSDDSAIEWIKMVESEKSRIREKDIYPRIRSWINRAMPSEILEIGAGQGVCSDQLDLEGRNYTGIEPSPLLVGRAKELYPHHPNRQFLEGNVYELPFPDSVFDATFSVAVWHLLKDLKKAASEMKRTLKQGGQFMIISANPNAYSLWTASYAESHQEGRRFEGKLKHPDQSVTTEVLYLHTLEEIQDSLHAQALKIELIETFRTTENSNGMKQFILIRGQRTN